MACNCGTKEEIDRIYQAYGEKLKTRDDMSVWEKVKHAFYVSFTILCWIVVFPLMVVYMLLFVFWHEPGDRNINIQNFNLLKIFHLGRYGRE